MRRACAKLAAAPADANSNWDERGRLGVMYAPISRGGENERISFGRSTATTGIPLAIQERRSHYIHRFCHPSTSISSSGSHSGQQRPLAVATKEQIVSRSHKSHAHCRADQNETRRLTGIRRAVHCGLKRRAGHGALNSRPQAACAGKRLQGGMDGGKTWLEEKRKRAREPTGREPQA
jgi:hypothetical protein